MSLEDVFSSALRDLEETADEEVDAALAGQIHLYLRGTFDIHAGSWRGRDDHDTLRRTCHAVEVLHHLHLDADSAAMVRDAGNWLINLPIHDHLAPGERARARLYPSRFKTLAYLGRFEDELVRRDFAELLRQSIDGMIRGVTESDVLTTCIVMDTLLSLEDAGLREEVCSDERLAAISRALAQQLRLWRPAGDQLRPRRNPHAAKSSTLVRTRRRAAIGSEIANARDLSYTLGLASQQHITLASRQVALITEHLISAIDQRDRIRGSDLAHALYAALQLAEHFREDERAQLVLAGLLADIRAAYVSPDVLRRWEFSHHTQVMRLLVAYYGGPILTQRVVARFLRAAERSRDTVQDTLATELRHVIQERIEIELGEVIELSGGFTSDHIYRVPFTYWYPMPGQDGQRSGSPRRTEASVIIKRSTSDAFHSALENYRLLPPVVRDLFVRQPSEMQVHKSGLSPAYYLTMEDLDSLRTLNDHLAEWDQRAMHEAHIRLLRSAAERLCETSFTLFRSTLEGRASFVGTQIARLYLSPIEAKLARAVARVPWLKNPLQGYTVGDQRFRALEYYLGVVAKHAQALQPRALGLTHGDLHAGNVMLDRACTQIKLIDLDKLSWNGDYLADLGNLLTDVCVYRRVAQPMREFGLPREEIQFVSHSSEPATAENVVRYPALGRPATLLLQEQVLARLERFAADLGDASWKPRLWLASAAALCIRLSFLREKEPAAVLYGEAVRLLHELCRHMEQGHDLPAVLVPATSVQPAAARAGDVEVPVWIAAQPALVRIHEGLHGIGLRSVADRSSVCYFRETGGDGLAVKLIEPRREGIARVLLPSSAQAPAHADGVKVVRSGQSGDGLGTILIIGETATPAAVLRLVSDALAARVSAR